MAAYRRERCSFEHGDPPISERLGSEVGGRSRRQLHRELGWEANARLGRLRRQLEGPDDTADADGGIDVFEPQCQLALLLGHQRSLEPGGDGAGRLVAGDHRVFTRCYDAAKVAQVELLDVGHGRIGAVEPFGDAEPWQEAFGHRQQSTGRHFWLALGLQSLVLLVDGLAHCRQPSLEGALCHGPLLFGKVGQHSVAMGAAGLETLGLRTLWELGGRGEVGASAALGARAAVGPGAASGTVATGAVARRAVGTGRRPITARWAVIVATRPAITTGSVSARRAVTTIAAVTPVAALSSRQLLCDGLERLVIGDVVEQTGLLGLLLAGRHRQDRHAIELDLGVGFQYGPDLCAIGQQRAVEHPFGYSGSGSAPRPGTIRARAGELDFDPSGHRPATVSGASRFAPP